MLDRRARTRWRPRASSSAPAPTSASSTGRRDAARREFDAVVLCLRRAGRRATCRSRAASSRASTSRWSTCRCRTSAARATTRARGEPFISAEGKHVVILGGGDTGADCLGTVAPPGRRVRPPVRAAAASRRTSAPPTTRGRSGRTSSASPRRTKRAASATTRCPPRLRRRRARATSAAWSATPSRRRKEDGRLVFKPVPGTEFELDADLVLLAMGFTAPSRRGWSISSASKLTAARHRRARRRTG